MDKKPESMIKTASFNLSQASFPELLAVAKKLGFDIVPDINIENFKFSREKVVREVPVRFFCTNFVDGIIMPNQEVSLVNSKQVINVMSQNNCLPIDLFRMLMIIIGDGQKFTTDFKSMAVLGSPLKVGNQECVPVVMGKSIHLVSNEINWGLRWCFPALPKAKK